jgi:ATP-binding cassette subfamily B protein
MENKKGKQAPGKHSGPNIFSILKPYRGLILVLIIFTLIGNGVNLVTRKLYRTASTAIRPGITR